MDKSPKICTRAEQRVLAKAGLLFDNDVAVPFLKIRNISKTVFPVRVDAGVATTSQLQTQIIPLKPLGANGLLNVPYKCTPMRSFCKVENSLNWWTRCFYWNELTSKSDNATWPEHYGSNKPTRWLLCRAIYTSNCVYWYIFWSVKILNDMSLLFNITSDVVHVCCKVNTIAYPWYI